MERIFFREEGRQEDSVPLAERVKIGVLGMGPGVGTTFVATSLALALSGDKGQRCGRDEENTACQGWNKGKAKEARQVGFLELTDRGCEHPLIYDSLGMDKRFAGREFIDFYDLARGKQAIKGLSNMEERINWALVAPKGAGEGQEDSAPPLSVIEKIRLLNNLSAHLVVCDLDCGAAQGGELEDILAELDTVVFVIDPMPSRLVCGYGLLSMVKGLELRGSKVVWVVNKYNRGVHHRELTRFLKLKNHIKIPLLSAEEFYGAEYNCKIPYSVKSIAEKTREQMEEISKLHQAYI